MHRSRPIPRAFGLTAMLACGVLAACQKQKPQTTPTPRPSASGNSPGGSVAGGLPGTPGAPGGTPNGGPAGAGGLPAGLAAALAGAGGTEPGPRPYAAVVTPGTRTSPGLVTTHQGRGRLYFESRPPSSARTCSSSGRCAARRRASACRGTLGGDRLVRWERRENRVLLRGVEYRNVVTDTTNPVARAVEIVTYAPILAALTSRRSAATRRRWSRSRGCSRAACPT
jgi:hypothetical protein